MKIVRSCRRAQRIYPYRRLQYEGVLRLKFDVLFLCAVDEARSILALEDSCDTAEFM